MTAASDNDRKHQEDLERLKNFRLIDDDFFTKCFDGDLKCVELVLRIVLDMPDLVVTSVRVQVFVKNLFHRSVRLDVLATDGEGRVYNIEIQRSDKGAGSKRARFNSSILDARHLHASEDFDELPETYVIFITEHDVLGRGWPVYRIERCILGANEEQFGDGAHIIYVNGEYRNKNTPVGKLMQDFFCSDPDKMNYDVLAERTRFFKKSKEGVAIMCRSIEEMRKAEREEGREEGRQEGLQEGIKKGRKEGLKEGLKEGMREGLKEGVKMMVRHMLDAGGYALEEISKISGLSFDEVRQIQAGQNM